MIRTKRKATSRWAALIILLAVVCAGYLSVSYTLIRRTQQLKPKSLETARPTLKPIPQPTPKPPTQPPAPTAPRVLREKIEKLQRDSGIRPIADCPVNRQKRVPVFPRSPRLIHNDLWDEWKRNEVSEVAKMVHPDSADVDAPKARAAAAAWRDQYDTMSRPAAVQNRETSKLQCGIVKTTHLGGDIPSWCDGVGPTSKASIHVVKNLCNVGTKWIIPVAAEDGVPAGKVIRTFDFEVGGVRYGAAVTAYPKSAWNSDGQLVEASVLGANVTMLTGTTALISQTYTDHIMHFLESLGVLSMAVRQDCSGKDKNELNCVGKIDRIVSLKQKIWHNSWFYHITRILMGDVGPHQRIPIHHMFDKLDGGIGLDRCYDRALLAGYYYTIFPPTPNADWVGFNQDVGEYLGRFGNHDVSSPESFANVADVDAGKAPLPRSILLSKRTAKRNIRDWDAFEELVKKEAATVNATVRTIQFGKHPFVTQAQASRDATILMGIHGADLTNSIFQRRGAAVVEINPFLFFENRFYDVARQLGHHYHSWTCTSSLCAFGGDTGEMLRMVPTLFEAFDPTTGVLAVGNKELVWPFDRYVGAACPDCGGAVGQFPLSQYYYGNIRQSDVRIEEHKDEIVHVLRRTFHDLGWITGEGLR